MPPKPKLKFKQLKDQLISQQAAINTVLGMIANEDPNAEVTQDQLETYETAMDAFQPGKAESTRRARVSC
jgi:hypothetical protein